MIFKLTVVESLFVSGIPHPYPSVIRPVNIFRITFDYFVLTRITFYYLLIPKLTAMKNHDRAPDKTQISISMSKALKAKIKNAAMKEGRSVSNYISFHLEDLLDELAKERSRYHDQSEK